MGKRWRRLPLFGNDKGNAELDTGRSPGLDAGLTACLVDVAPLKIASQKS